MGTLGDKFILDCPSYEYYLDSHITRKDLYYLRDPKYCRIIVKLGYRSNADVYTPEEFEKRKQLILDTLFPKTRMTVQFSDGLELEDPVLKQLAAREAANNQKIISTIIFLNHRFKSGFEISGYIDFEHSLRRANLRADGARDWRAIFEGRVKLRPRPSDLSYFDWHKKQNQHTDSDNFVVVNDAQHGLIFMHKGDHKKICIDISHESYAKNCNSEMHFSDKYDYVILYDHVIRKKI